MSEEKKPLSQDERNILKEMARAVPKMNDYMHGYLLGYGRAMNDRKRPGDAGQGKDGNDAGN